MNELDWAILAVIGLSALISVMRGFVKEVLSLIVWCAAFFFAFVGCGPLSENLTFIESSTGWDDGRRSGDLHSRDHRRRHH